MANARTRGDGRRRRATTEEVWAEIPDCPGYIASTLGRVMGPTGVVLRPQRKRQTHGRGKIYLYVDIREKRISVHKLVLTAFIGPRLPGTQCRHLNDDPTDNRLANLAWGGQPENRVDDIKNGRVHLLTAAEIEHARTATQIPIRTMAAQLGVSKSLVQMIRTRQVWKAKAMKALKYAEAQQRRREQQKQQVRLRRTLTRMKAALDGRRVIR